ncbi:MAG TPA: TIGR03435 family protein [Terriglobia bacterium]
MIAISTVAVMVSFVLLCSARQQSLAFEVASVKLNRNPPPLTTRAINLDVLVTHGRLTLEALSLRTLILVADELQKDQVHGCPRWCDSEMFDVVAKADDPNATPAEIEMMLRTLLRDRFKLVSHREQQQRPGFVLTIGKNGPKLKLAKEDETSSATKTDSVRTFQKISMEGLVNFLAASAGQPVVDTTGLKGLYDFTIDLTPSTANPQTVGGGFPAATDPGNSFFTRLSLAVEDQLGLKLQPKQVPVEGLVIDSVEHPSEN